MLLLAFLLFPIALRAERHWNYSTYVATSDDDVTLTSIKPTCSKSSVNCPNELDYKSLRSLNLSGLDLEYVADHVFDRFDQLSSLSLASNKLTTLPEFVFSKLTNLSYLDLANNKISIFKNTFVGLNNLDNLDVSNNKLLFFEEGYFFGIPQKTNIIVKDNRISSINSRTFQNSNESHKCTAENNDELKCEYSDSETPSVTSSRDIFVEVCIEKQNNKRHSWKHDKNIVNSVKNLENQKPSKGCEKIVMNDNKLNLTYLNIRKFKNNWYRINDTVLVKEICIAHNNIRNITGAILKSLPETVTTLDLSSNKFGSIGERPIENMNSLATNLSVLHLSNNSLSNTKLIANLPSSLTELNLSKNIISKIVTGSFSNLKRLLKLRLSYNKLTVLSNNDLPDISSLEYLDLSFNNLSHIMPDAFLNLRNLRELDLSHNKLYSLSTDTFRGLDNIQSLNLKWNSIRDIMPDAFLNLRKLGVLNLGVNKLYGLSSGTFKGLDNIQSLNLSFNLLRNITGIFVNMSDTLLELLLAYNKIEFLGVNSFVKVPKESLNLGANKISRIEMDAFDLPNLEELNLDMNNLSKLNGDSFNGLPRLKRLLLGRNNIKEINSDFWKHLNNTVEDLSIWSNPIKMLKNGDLCGMSKRGNGEVGVSNTQIETIRAGVFSRRCNN